MIDWSCIQKNGIVTKEPKKFRILSIDGGGMKGVIPAQYLKRIENETNKPISHFFDLITGTSTGGIIALGLSIGLSASDLVDFYVNEGVNIFSNEKKRNLFRKQSSLYSNTPLKNILQKVFEDKKIKDSNNLLCIPSIEHHKAQPKVYKTPHHENFYIDGDRLMHEVALATSAAPSYFPTAAINNGEHKIDGGLWANNPVLVGISEATFLGFGLEQIEVLSLGTGNSFYSTNSHTPFEGINPLNWINNLVDLAMQSQSKGAHFTAKNLIGSNLIRIDPTFRKKINLDSTEIRDIELMQMEANQIFADSFKKEGVEEKFFSSILQIS